MNCKLLGQVKLLQKKIRWEKEKIVCSILARILARGFTKFNSAKAAFVSVKCAGMYDLSFKIIVQIN